MLRLALSSLRPRRLVPTALAIVLSVAFVAGILVYRDTASAALYDEYARGARNVGVAVTATGGARLPMSTVDSVRDTAGVADVDGRMSAPLPLLDRHGKPVTTFGEPPAAVDTGSVPALRGFDLRAGRLPARGGEAALDSGTVEATGISVGDTAVVVDAGGARQELRVVGTVDSAGGAPTVVLTRAELVRLTGASGFREVVATLRPGADAGEVRDRIAAGGPGQARFRTGEQLRHDLARAASGQLSGVFVGLVLFAAVAVLVAGFVIFNTFNILMTQRIRETALLRCVGTRRGQVMRLVLLESAAVGLAASLVGAVAGLGVAAGLARGGTLLGLPGGRPVLSAPPLLVAVGLGLLVTVVSAAVPALRAARVPPVAALRITGEEPRRRWTFVLAGLALAGGAALTAAGLRARGAEEGMVLVMAGGTGTFLALLLLSPLLVGRLVAALGWLPARVFGVPARLAAANARRNPGRTAATTATLVIGVALMAGGSTIAATVDRTATAQLDRAFPVDYLVVPAVNGATIPPSVTASLSGDPAFASVEAVRQADAVVDGRSVLVGTGGVADGTARVPAASDVLGRARPGDRLTVRAGERALTVTVAATVQGPSLTGDLVVSPRDFASLFPGGNAEAMILVRATPGAAARERLDAALTDAPLVRYDDLADVRDDRKAAVDQLVGIIAVLLACALLIALVGIANTLSLSVLERARESALLRALGLTRRQLAATLLVEALLMATAGALIGVAFGVLYGWLTTLAGFGAVDPLVAVPVGRLGLFVLLAALAGVAAAVLPARRAALSAVLS
ncbi:ABC transporter permease [Dactylosporangium sp. AC04546]|uniref:ABC transporter permease n=1 Tax=Dactylosporangium sp. AC04546 TaxID=2862460 RepID=UPI001EDCCEE7|nr:ABC transporter permease [Dactylosporangium sp. AC04546]WVK87520.1 ABC transporter permease [Dactylosporangium sp. AC04546]